MSQPHRILVLDNDLHQSQMLQSILAAHSAFQLAAMHKSIAEVKKTLRADYAELLIVNLNTETDTLAEFVQWLKTRRPAMEVLIIADSPHSRELVLCAKAGATGFALSSYDAVDMIFAINQMFEDGSHIHPKIAQNLLHALVNSADVAQVSEQAEVLLTPREKDVLAYLAKGFTCAEIAEALTISNHTVSSHVKNLYKKLHIHTKGEAVMEAVRMGLVNVRRASAL